MDIHERLAEFYRRLMSAQPAATAEEAMAQVSRLIEEVEDEYCSIPREEPPPLGFTGRMYAPQPDRIRRTGSGALVATSRRHRITCGTDGSIVIELVQAHQVEFIKEGSKK